MSDAARKLDLAEVARGRYACADAEVLYSEALEHLPPGDPALRFVALRGRALVRYRLGRLPEALADFAQARSAVRELGDGEAEVELLLAHATALDWHNDYPAAARLVDEAEALALTAGVRTRPVIAGLLVGRGRSLFRAGRWSQASQELTQGVRAAEQLGAQGYEPLVIALILLEVILPGQGRSEEAQECADRAVALTQAHGDLLNLASALNNRRNLLVARKDLEAALQDQRTFREIGQSLGNALAEYFAEYNIAELLYQAGQTEAAAPHALRATAFEASHPAIASRPVASLLRARLLAFQGLVAEARALLEEVRSASRRAQEENRLAGVLAPSEEVLLTMVDLVTRESPAEATEEEWDALLVRSERDSLEQEPIEVAEMRALFELRRGREEPARRAFARALQLASIRPNLIEERIRRGGQLPS